MVKIKNKEHKVYYTKHLVFTMAAQSIAITAITELSPFMHLPEELLELILRNLDETSQAICMRVCKELRLLILRITKDRIPKISASDLVCSVSLLKWQSEILGRPITKHTLVMAARGGHMRVLRWAKNNTNPLIAVAWKNVIHEEKPYSSSHYKVPVLAAIWRAAAQGGQLDVLIWGLSNNYFQWHFEIPNIAARYGHIEILTWVRLHRYAFSAQEVCENIALSGNVANMKWAKPHDYPMGKSICSFAIRSGNLRMVQYVRNLGYQFDAYAISACVRIGKLDIIQYVYEMHPLPLVAGDCRSASTCGHLNILKWLREHGCPWDYSTVGCAFTDEIRHWAIANGCPH